MFRFDVHKRRNRNILVKKFADKYAILMSYDK